MPVRKPFLHCAYLPAHATYLFYDRYRFHFSDPSFLPLSTQHSLSRLRSSDTLAYVDLPPPSHTLLLLTAHNTLTLHLLDLDSGQLRQLDLSRIADLVGQWLPEASTGWVDKVIKKGRGKWLKMNCEGPNEGRVIVHAHRWVISQGVLWDAQTDSRT